MDSSLSNTTLDDVINAMYHFMRSQDGAVCIEGMHLLRNHLTKCVDEGWDSDVD